MFLISKLPPVVLGRKQCTTLRKPLAGSIKSENALWCRGIFKQVYF